ncbi:hypothetical protein HAX54_048419 [Datura stramonium]|uniref:Uncharacterized protein n=1 Tax=Datura stramonium TaxID=4076 RepID=A0ABS8WJC1_DATST|nr:hypothetical protein [Datura stramonium]
MHLVDAETSLVVESVIDNSDFIFSADDHLLAAFHLLMFSLLFFLCVICMRWTQAITITDVFEYICASQSLRRDVVLRTFKLSTGQDDHAIMFLDDYFSQIERASKRLEAQKQEDLSVFEWFKEHDIFPFLLSGGFSVHFYRWEASLIVLELYALCFKGKIIAGGPVWHMPLGEREERSLSPSTVESTKEMAMAAWKKVSSFPLDMRFHLRDLLGSRHLKTVEAPTGLVVKAVKD